MKKYKRHLENFFEYMFNNPDINAKCAHISSYCASIYSKLKSMGDKANWSLSIDPPWIIPIENDDDFLDHTGYLIIGGRIIVEQFHFTFYSFSACIVVDGKIIRRFHFDMDTTAKSASRAPKPRCHMQYGGDAQRELKHIAKLQHSLDTWLRKPRFPFPPIDLILLLDLWLRQIETSISRKFVEEPFWRNLVKGSERLRISDYYGQINQYFTGEPKHTLFEMLFQ